MIILCQEDFNEQIEKLVNPLFSTAENCGENTKPGHILYQASNPRVKECKSQCLPLSVPRRYVECFTRHINHVVIVQFLAASI
jgi:hypothetical protein